MNEKQIILESKDWLTSRQRRALWIFLAVIGLLRVLLLFEMPMLDKTESRYAEIARKMVETDDWVTPQFDYGVPFWGKPPLHTWASAFGIKLFGPNHFGARIFIFIAAVLTLWMLYHWVRSIKGRDDALVGISILASTALYFLSGAYVMTDLLMAASVYLTIMGFYSAVLAHKHARLWSYLFFVGLGIGMLAKGPVAIVLAALPIVLWVLLKNRWGDAWKRLPWVVGLLLTCAIFMPWYVSAELKTRGFVEYFIIGEHLHRFLDSGWKGDLYGSGHAEARGMIWVFWLGAVFPWSLFFLVPLLHAKQLLNRIRNETDGWSLYLVCWAVSPMIFFTLATNILSTYVITGLPAISFLVINFWRYARKSDSPPRRGLIRFFTATAAVAICMFFTAYVVFLMELPFGVKKTEKYVVRKFESIRTAESGILYYYKSRIYSAEFYSNGRAKTLASESELLELLGNNTRDFVCIKRGSLDKMPAAFGEQFELIQEFSKTTLYYERPLADVTRSVR